ncbi:MAG: putative bifunctional diguanylate cyclase/phosphodiesterase [Vicinamibacterales bacterium]
MDPAQGSVPAHALTLPGRGGLAWWPSRLEARVALALGLLVAVALGAIFLATTRAVASQSRERATAELAAASRSFHDLVAERVTGALGTAQLVTELPVFRAHLTDVRLAADTATVSAMADGYRAQVGAEFAVVARRGGEWAAQPGWTGAPPAAEAPLQRGIARALAGEPGGQIVHHDGALYVIVAVPARFADEVLGALAFGYRVSDEVVRQLARGARCEAVIIAGGAVVASSLARAAASAEALVEAASAGSPTVLPDLWTLGARRFVTGVFAVARPDQGGDAGRLILLSDWQPTQEFIDRLRDRFALAGIAILFLSLVGGSMYSHRLSQPLRDIAAAASEVAAGNLQLTLPERGSEEAVVVARAFNDMSTSLRTARDRLTHDATHDVLTHLPNRVLLMERLDRSLVRRVRHPDYCFAVLFLDLDRFKHVNDSLGHRTGDLLLVRFAERLAAAVRRDDAVMRVPGAPDVDESTLARFGGDEFVVLLDDIRSPVDAVRVAERIQRLSAQPLAIGGQEVFATSSIGVAVSAATHQSADELVRDADLAMYRAKQAGGNGYAVFDGAMHALAVRRLRLETELRRAAERGEFRVHYQPIVSLKDRRTIGFEALVRWQHPERGLLAPGEFLAVADEVGIIAGIDDFVLRQACRQGVALMAAGPGGPVPTMSVNLSAKSFAQASIVEQVAAAARLTGFPATSLRIEITESTAIDDVGRARHVLTELRKLGVRVSIDDFGTGYCALSYLQAFPLDALKIDRSFVAGLGQGGGQREIVQLVIALAATLGLDVIAEGTETEAQVDELTSLGCGYGQGYFFAPPLDPSDLTW